MPGDGTLTAVIWDFDGTIADSMRRNISVACAILTALGKDPSNYRVLDNEYIYAQHILSYVHWTDFYVNELGLTLDETRTLGKMWGPYQKRSTVPYAPYEGIEEVIRTTDMPQGIFSINSGPNIKRFLKDYGLEDYFSSIVGYEHVDGKEKPDPSGLIACALELNNLSPGIIAYIGDHQSDILCSRKANEIFQNAQREQDKPYPRIEMVWAKYIYKNYEVPIPAEINTRYSVEAPQEIPGMLQKIQADEMAQSI